MMDSAEQGDTIFTKLAANAKEVTMPVGDTFLGAPYVFLPINLASHGS